MSEESAEALEARGRELRAAGRADDARDAFYRAFQLDNSRFDALMGCGECCMALADYDVLVQLAAATPHQLRMGELADRLLLSRSGITRLIDRLERAGFVTRATCDTDRRGSWAVLTDAGYARLREATPSHLRGVAEHFIDRIPSDELVALEETLARILD